MIAGSTWTSASLFPKSSSRSKVRAINFPQELSGEKETAGITGSPSSRCVSTQLCYWIICRNILLKLPMKRTGCHISDVIFPRTHLELGLPVREYALPTNQTANRSTNQSTNRPINWSTYQSSSQPINQPTNQSTSQSINQTSSQSINQPTNQSVDQLMNQTVNLSINLSTSQSINQSIDHSINQSMDHSINQPINQSINQLRISADSGKAWNLACSRLSNGGKEKSRRGDWGSSLARFTFHRGFFFFLSTIWEPGTAYVELGTSAHIHLLLCK